MSSKIELSLLDDDPWIIEKHIFDIVCSFVQPDSTQHASDAVRALDSLYPAHRIADVGGSSGGGSAADKKRRSSDAAAGGGSGNEPPESAGTFLWNLWPVFFSVAQQLPMPSPLFARASTSLRSSSPGRAADNSGDAAVAHDRLAELVALLSNTASPRTPTIVLNEWGDAERRLWQDLPLLGPSFYETWDRK
jgi:hypothetical protein